MSCCKSYSLFLKEEAQIGLILWEGKGGEDQQHHCRPGKGLTESYSCPSHDKNSALWSSPEDLPEGNYK